MIYPTTCGKADGKELHLATLDAIWIKGKLKMWGRWSRIGRNGAAQSAFSRLLCDKTLTKTAIKNAIRQMKKAGISKEELFSYFGDPDNPKACSSLTFCTDDEGLLIDAVIGAVLSNTPGLIDIIQEHYIAGRKKTPMAEAMHHVHPELSPRTCERRIDVWLKTAEFMLFQPLRDAFYKNADESEEKSLIS